MHDILMINSDFLTPALTAGTGTAGAVTMAETRGVAVIQICGPLSHRPSGGLLSMLMGETATYEQIRQLFNEAVADEAIGSIVFDIDSPGGEVAGCFDLVDTIYNARGKKPIYATVNECACSAAYAIASAADKIFISRTGQAGSIGVMALHVDQSELDKMAGLKFTAIYAGKRKNDGNAHEPLSDEAEAEIRTRVHRTYQLFAATVARNRGMTTETIKRMESAIYTGQDAIEAGLADQIKSYDDVINTLIRGENMTLKTDLRALIAGKRPEDIAEAMLACGYVPADQVKTDDMAEKLLDIIDLCELAGMNDIGMIRKILDDGLDPKKAKTAILKTKTELAERGQIFSTVSATATGEVNPLIADAQKRVSALK